MSKDSPPKGAFLALVYKKCLYDKVIMSLTAIQNMEHLKRVNNNYINIIIIVI